MVEITKKLTVTTREEWRAWLKKNHGRVEEIWLVYFKKHTGKPTLPYDHAVEEALCFGWIDSIVKRIDDARYAQKFTPRRQKSIWSELNRKRAKKLIRSARMTGAGLEKIKEAKISGEWYKKEERGTEPVMKRDVTTALSASKKAWENFKRFSPSHRKQCLGWIESAKKVETRARRIEEVVRLASLNKKLGMK